MWIAREWGWDARAMCVKGVSMSRVEECGVMTMMMMMMEQVKRTKVGVDERREGSWVVVG